MVVEEAAAAVEFNGRVAVVNLKMKEFGVVLAGHGFGEVEKLRANSLSSVRGFYKEFVDPSAFTTIFQAVVEADHQICDRGRLLPDNIDNATNRIHEKLG